MNTTRAIMQRELNAYFATPVAYVFIIIFLVLAAALPFYLGGFFERNEASLQAFFSFHPWLYLFLVPAIAMRLWAEERKSGTIELLLTLPVTPTAAVLGKFLAAWLFIGLCLCLTFPMWITVNYLGAPDNGVILAAYIGSWLMAGGFLAIGSCLSATTRNQVVAFILSVLVCFGFLVAGHPLVLNAARVLLPQFLVDGIANLSFYTHFSSISKGVISLADGFYFLLVMAAWLVANLVVLELRKAD